MNISCDIIMDLIPIYKDGVASEDSKKAVEEHILTCKDCAEMCKMYTPEAKPKKAKIHTGPESYKKRTYSSLAEELHKQKVIDKLTFSTTLALSAGIGVYCLYKMYVEDKIKK